MNRTFLALALLLLTVWLAMPFFSLVAMEVDRFYHNPACKEKNLTLDWWPVGSGAPQRKSIE